MDYKVIRSKRKTMTMLVERDGTVIIKAPKHISGRRIEKFYRNSLDWIEQRREEHKRNAAAGIPPTERQIEELKKQAKSVMTLKTEYFASVMGVKFTGVKITSAKKRWGSCSKKGFICYSYRVMLLSQRCQDYIVVHELCHLMEFNHSENFYRLIEKYLPDYREREKELKRFSGYDLY